MPPPRCWGRCVVLDPCLGCAVQLCRLGHDPRSLQSRPDSLPRLTSRFVPAFQICFVGDEAFRELSREDDEAPTLLQRAMSKDMSKEWREAAAQAGKAPASPTAALKAPAAAAVPAAAAAVAAPTVPAPGAGSPKAAAAAVAGGK